MTFKQKNTYVAVYVMHNDFIMFIILNKSMTYVRNNEHYFS